MWLVSLRVSGRLFSHCLDINIPQNRIESHGRKPNWSSREQGEKHITIWTNFLVYVKIIERKQQWTETLANSWEKDHLIWIGFSEKPDFLVFRELIVTGDSKPSQQVSRSEGNPRSSLTTTSERHLLWTDFNSRELIRPMLSSHREISLPAL